MKEIKSALVVGAGAIGAAVASRMYDIDPASVALCASGKRKERYARDGFVINEKRYAFHIADEKIDPPYDLILVAVKSYALEEAVDAMRPFVGDDTTILSLLNGITSEERLRAEFGVEKVPLALMIGIDALRIGNKIDFGHIGEIRFGFEKNDPSRLADRVAAASRFLAAHNLPAVIPEDMVRALWYKFLFNVAVNQWSAVLRAPYGLFHKSPAARELLAVTMREVLAISAAYGVDLGEADIKTILTTLDRMGAEGRTSMLQDVDARRKTEVETFAGVVVEKARSAGLKAPVNQALFLAIRAMEEDFGL